MNQTRVPFKKFTEGDFICEIRRLNRAITKLSYERDDLQQENQQLKDRINKAVEYIEDKLKIYPEGLVGKHLGQEFLKDISDLLKGDKE